MALTDNAWYVNAATGFVVTNIGSNSNTSGATLTITNVTVPAGALIVILASEATSGSAGTIGDGTNTYSTAASGAMSTAAGFGTIFYKENASALSAATITYTKQTSGRICSLAAFYVTGGLSSSSLDSAFTNSTAVNSATPTVTSSAAPAQAGELIIGCCAYSNASNRTLTNPTGFLTPFTNVQNTTAQLGGGNYNAGGTSALTYSPTLSAASDNRTFLIAFKPATNAVGYWAKTSWKASNTQHCGDLTRPNVTAINNERMFVCIASTSGTGTTGSSEPATLSSGATRGLKVSDNTVTWQECTGIAALNGDLSTNTPNWTTIKNTAITLGQVIQNNAGNLVLICTTAGTAGNGSEPSWAAFTNAGATTSDNTVTWTTLGASFSGWSAPHARTQNAFTSTWGQNGNFFYIGHAHNEIQTTALTLTGGAIGTPFKAICVNTAGSVPPVAADSRTTAIISTSGAVVVNVEADAYWYGITFLSSADGTSSALNPTVGVVPMVLDNCVLNCNTTAGSTSGFLNGTTTTQNAFVELRDTKVKLGSAVTAAWYYLGGTFIWRNNGSSAFAAGSSFPATNILRSDVGGSSIIALLEGLDLSSFTGTEVVNVQSCFDVVVTIKDCKLSASQVVANAALAGNYNSYVNLIRADSGTQTVRTESYSETGNETTEVTAVRSGGATDGVTLSSQKIATNGTGTTWAFPFKMLPIAVWNGSTGSSLTLTMHGLYLGASLPNNNEAWMNVEYLGASGSPVGSFVYGGLTANLGAASALTADTTADWTSQAAAYQTAHAYGAFTGFIKAGNASPQQLWYMSSHSGTGTSGSDSTIFNGKSDGATATDNAGANQIVWQAVMRFSQALSFTPQLAGPVTAYWNFGKQSATYYIDPRPDLAGSAISRMYALAPGVLVNATNGGGNFAFIQ